jgi:hypothetical protein
MQLDYRMGNKRYLIFKIKTNAYFKSDLNVYSDSAVKDMIIAEKVSG